MTWYDMIWHDMIWYDMIWHNIIWYDMIWHDMIWYDMIWYDMIWYDMIELLSKTVVLMNHSGFYIRIWIIIFFNDSPLHDDSSHYEPSSHITNRPSYHIFYGIQHSPYISLLLLMRFLHFFYFLSIPLFPVLYSLYYLCFPFSLLFLDTLPTHSLDSLPTQSRIRCWGGSWTSRGLFCFWGEGDADGGQQDLPPRVSIRCSAVKKCYTVFHAIFHAMFMLW